MFEKVAERAGHEVSRRRPGFEFTPVLLGKVTSYLVTPPSGPAGIFAFMYRFPELDGRPPADEKALAETALDVILAAIDGGRASGVERTFELLDGTWSEVSKPAWWIPVGGPRAGGARA